MPISLSAKKSLRKSLKNRKENVSFKNKFKSVAKEYLAKPTKEGLEKVYSLLDKLKKKNIFHKNKVARLKSSFAKKTTPAEVKKVSPAKKKAAPKAKKTARKVAKKA